MDNRITEEEANAILSFLSDTLQPDAVLGRLEWYKAESCLRRLTEVLKAAVAEDSVE